MKKRLTSVVLSALRPKATAYYVSDEQQNGLRVRVAPSGAVTWNLAYRIKSEPKTRSVSLGPCDPSAQNGLGLAEARERASDIIKAARQGRNLLEEEKEARQTKQARLPVKELIERYAKTHQESAPQRGRASDGWRYRAPAKACVEHEARLCGRRPASWRYQCPARSNSGQSSAGSRKTQTGNWGNVPLGSCKGLRDYRPHGRDRDLRQG